MPELHSDRLPAQAQAQARDNKRHYLLSGPKRSPYAYS